MSSLILTARLNSAAQILFDALRERHFPPERNFLSAHLTLFHALPANESASIESQLAALCKNEAPMCGVATRPRSLGNGLAIAIECDRLIGLREVLAKRWDPFLGRQDSQVFRPHITIQNKVSSAVARQLLADLQQTFTPTEVVFDGLDLWLYLGGPWQLIEAFPFGISHIPAAII